jgi:hypothetical protein
MQITRHNHVRYMAKMTPFLLFLYIGQVLLYQRFAPPNMTSDINLFLGIGLAFIIMCYQFYDHHHKIIFKENFLEVSFDLLKMKEEILYRNIVHVEITKKKHYYGNITLHLKDGSIVNLYHVDSPEFVQDWIEKKQLRRAS